MKRIPVFIAALVWMGLIFYGSSLPGSETGPDTPLWVFMLKTLHFMNFGVLALLYLAVLKGKQTLACACFSVFALGLLLTVLYAMSDEYHQKFSAGRHSSIKDVMIDTMGASAFLGTTFLLRRKKETENNESRDLQSPGSCRGNAP